MNKINARIIADSICPRGHRLTTYILTYPRFIHSELMTHRLFSKNSASSRAIPFEKMVKMVEEDPFIPIAWQKDHKGMQGSEYITDETDIQFIIDDWLTAKDWAVGRATAMNIVGVTKQICNRLLEPFMWHTVILTASEFDNFFELRCPKYHSPVDTHFRHKSKKDLLKAHSNPINLQKFSEFTEVDWLKMNKGQSEIHMMQLAECMWDARNESVPKSLKEGEYHIPFGDNVRENELLSKEKYGYQPANHPEDEPGWVFEEGEEKYYEEIERLKLKVATARCARISYLNFEGKDDYQSDIKLYDTLLQSGHYSPFEHCARVMSNKEYNTFIKGKSIYEESTNSHIPIGDSLGWCRNFRGFIQLRAIIEE